MLLKQLLKYYLHDDTIPMTLQMEIIKFLIASYSSMELRCRHRHATKATSSSASKQQQTDIIIQPPPQQQQQKGVIEGPLIDLVGVRLWGAIFHRKRHLEMKRDGMLRKRYGLFKARSLSKHNTTTTSNGKVDDADDDDDEEDEMRTNAGFLPSMVDGLVDAIIILGNAAATSEEVAVGSSKEEEQRQHGRDDLLLLRNYASKVLELLLDLLSYPQTRTHVASHISSQNLVVQLRMSK
jgi:hypothetical protein